METSGFCTSTLGTLETFAERLGCNYSTLNFQAVKVKACALGLKSSAAMRVWNAAWLQCQEVRQHLEKMQKKGKSADKIQSRRSSAASPQAVEGGEGDGCERGDGESLPTLQMTSGKEQVQQPETEEAGTINGEKCITPDPKGVETDDLSVRDAPPAAKEEGKTMLVDGGHHSSFARRKGGRLREHRSDVDLSRADLAEGNGDLPRQPLGRSLSEGSHGNLPLTPLNVRNNTCQLLPEVNLLAVGSCKSQGAKEEEEHGDSVASNQPPKGSPVQPEPSATQSNGCDVL